MGNTRELMEAALIGLAVVVVTVATGMFLVAVRQHLWRPAAVEQPRRRRAAIAACCVMPAAAAIVLALVDVSDAEAFLAITAITFSSLGLGIWIALRSV